ncbi:hypothetical protein EYZ11_009277 [Aspergillus tanneri]|uniref:Uncharacterized protein n=1 Tax=Aspergillus tanneri TaxID=1220188 RepID=A0A4S3JAG0_9EURO|nr:hypothetical protein EYZ11_009277 [Aspergillus tanneri]
MAQIAKGVTGFDNEGNRKGAENDAVAFAIYATATWVNAVYWYSGYKPKDRGAF